MKRSILILLASLLFYGCPVGSGDEGTGVVSITLGHAEGSRTIIPSLGPVVSEYRIVCIGPRDMDPVFTSEIQVDLVLQTGVWDITITALNDKGEAIAADTLQDVHVASGASIALTAKLTAFQDGLGSIDLTFLWPDSVSIPLDNIMIEFDEIIIENSSDSVEYSIGSLTFRDPAVASSSNHKISVSLKPVSSNTPTIVIDILHVYDFMVTSHTYTLLENDFLLPPRPPVFVSAVTTDVGITLNWSDCSNTETGFIIRRSAIDNFESSEYLTQVEAGMETYTDTSAVQGSSYYYFITAENGYGESVPSESGRVDYLLDSTIRIDIVISEPESEAITFSEADLFTVSQGAVLTLSTGVSFEAYEWFVDGDSVSGQTESVFSYDCSGLPPGLHRITLIGTRGSSLFSETIRFLVEE